MMKDQIAKSTTAEVAKKKSQASDVAAAAGTPAKTAEAAAAASATYKKVNERDNHILTG